MCAKPNDKEGDDFEINDSKDDKEFREKETKKSPERTKFCAPTRMKWPPSEPQYGNVDRREGIEEARKNPDFNKFF